MPTIGKPKIETRRKEAYMGIRTITPFKGMSKAIQKLSDEMNAWVNESKDGQKYFSVKFKPKDGGKGAGKPTPQQQSRPSVRDDLSDEIPF